MDILSPLLKPKIFNIRGKFLLGLRLNIKITYLCFCINLNSYNTFTGNVIFDLHALPGFGIFTFFFVVDEVDEPGTYYQTSSNNFIRTTENFGQKLIFLPFVRHFKIPYLSFAQLVKPHPSALQSSLYLRLALPHFFKEEHPVVFVAVQGQVTPSVENAIHAMKKERFVEPKFDPSNYRYNFLLLGRILIMRETTTYSHLRRVQQNKSPMQEQRRSSF